MLPNYTLQSTRFAALFASMFTLGAGRLFPADLIYNSSTAPTHKIQQVSGPCDYTIWDPKTPPTTDKKNVVHYGTPGSCGPTAASLGTPNEILGQGLGYSFEADGNLIILFGDTVGVASGVTLDPDPSAKQILQFEGKDTMASTSGFETPGTLTINYYAYPTASDPAGPLFVTANKPDACGASSGSNCLPPQPNGAQPSRVPDGTPIPMGGDNIPNSGIYLSGKVNGTSDHTFLVIDTGSDDGASSKAYSVLVSFDGNHTFTPGRTISQSLYTFTEIGPTPPIKSCGTKCVARPALVIPPYQGHFVINALYELPLPLAKQWLGLNEPAVLIYGEGQYRQSSLYLSYIPESEFWTGVDAQGNPATQYFTGLDNKGNPSWSGEESDAVPVLWDNPPSFKPADPDPGTIGNASIYYDSNTQLWFVTYDGGRQSGNEMTTGIYFAYSTTPWGKFATPQLIYNACAAISNHQGYGDLLNYYWDGGDRGAPNSCPDALSYAGKSFPDKTCASNDKAQYTGPVGPIIGTNLDPFGCAAFTERAGPFAPEMIGRFTSVTPDGKTLKLCYNMSTWNPYTVVEMETDFQIQ